jgi:pyruvate/2-oxoglutarate dehydrogenase complex dihydrolipoamide acyltransferase (E2) component
MPKKLNVRELLKDGPYADKAKVLAIKIEGWGLDNDRDIHSLPVHGKVMGVNPNLIVAEIVSQSLKTPEEPPQEVAAEEEPDWLRATPAALELAEESGVNLSTINGSGKEGTIVKSDVEKLILEEDIHDD